MHAYNTRWYISIYCRYSKNHHYERQYLYAKLHQKTEGAKFNVRDYQYYRFHNILTIQ